MVKIKLPQKAIGEEVMMTFRLNKEKKARLKEIAKSKGLKLKEVFEIMIDTLIKQEM